jgi:hypothetical protein
MFIFRVTVVLYFINILKILSGSCNFCLLIGFVNIFKFLLRIGFKILPLTFRQNENDFPVFRYSGIPVFGHSGVPAFRCSFFYYMPPTTRPKLPWNCPGCEMPNYCVLKQNYLQLNSEFTGKLREAFLFWLRNSFAISSLALQIWKALCKSLEGICNVPIGCCNIPMQTNFILNFPNFLF